jgi:hypothetical protein
MLVFTLPIAETHLPVGITFTTAAVASGLLGRYYRKREEARRSPEVPSTG